MSAGPIDPRTGKPIRPITFPDGRLFLFRGRPIWPVMGGSEPAPEPPADPPASAPAPAEPPAPAAEPEQDWKAEARKWEQRAKDNFSKAKAFDELEAANASELEKATKAAEDARAAVEVANRRAVTAEVRALADGFVDREDAVLRLGDLSKYVTDGDVDLKAIRTDLAEVLKKAPHLAKPEPSEPTPKPPAGRRPVETLRPGAAPTEGARPSSLGAAIAEHYAQQT